MSDREQPWEAGSAVVDRIATKARDQAIAKAARSIDDLVRLEFGLRKRGDYSRLRDNERGVILEQEIRFLRAIERRLRHLLKKAGA